jgi:hypothetical protein
VTDGPTRQPGRAIAGGKVVKIDMLGDPERLDQLDLTILND